MLRTRPAQDPATRILLICNVVIFLLELMLAPGRRLLLDWFFGLTPDGLAHGYLWQLVTYQFLHANEVHILVNMLGLWFVGRELEAAIGTARFTTIYFLGGVIGGLAQITLAPTHGPLIGASASVCAVLLAFTTLFPSMPIMALLFFVLPLRMRAATLGYAMVGLSVLFWLSHLQPQVGHLAHLGGFATGWVYGMIFRRREDRAGVSPEWESPDGSSGSGARGFHRAETIDAVLAKVLREGIDSLTRDERRILEESRGRRRWG